MKDLLFHSFPPLGYVQFLQLSVFFLQSQNALLVIRSMPLITPNDCYTVCDSFIDREERSNSSRFTVAK